MGEGARRWHSDPWRLLVGLGAGVALPAAAVLQVVYEYGLLAAITTGLALVMLLIGGIGWVGAVVGEKRKGWSPSAMVTFISTEAVAAVGLLMVYWVIRLQADVWPPDGSPDIPVPVLPISLLLLASLTGGLAGRSMLRRDTLHFANLTLVTVVVWMGFATMTVFGWIELSSTGFTIYTNTYGAVYYCITGIHFAHVLFGIVILLLALPPAFKGLLSESYTRSMTMYIHYVNLLGLAVLTQLTVW